MNDLLDRSEMIEAMRAALEIDPARTAVVGVDLHRGHLDPEVATFPLPAQQAAAVVQATERLLAIARAAGMKVIQVVQTQRRHPTPSADILSNPFWATMERLGLHQSPTLPSTISRHNLEGSPGTELMPSLATREDEFLLTSKHRLTAFYGTDLDGLLRSLGVETLLLAGVNTNTCITGTAFEAMHRDYRVVVVEECVASAHGDDLHRFALENIARCIGWVITLDELEPKVTAAVG
jgi:nicotinamidase-related amidase